LSNGTEFAVKKEAGWSVRATARASEDCKIGVYRKLKVVVRGSAIKGYLDGKLVVESNYCVDRGHGCIGLGASGCIVEFDNLKIRLLPKTSKAVRSNPKPCEIIAHRGCSLTAPENTISSLKRSIELGIDGSEIDIQSTKDGFLVLMHDETVDRVTNGQGKVKDLELSYIKTLDAGSWKHTRYIDERVPTLVEVLELFKNSDQDLVIDIKGANISKRIIDVVKAKSMQSNIVMITSSLEVIQKIHEVDSQIRCGWICGGFPRELSSEKDKIKWVYQQARKHKVDILDFHYKLLSKGIIRELQKRKIEVWVWTVNEQEVMKALMSWNIDAITTDRPGLLKTIRSSI